MSIKKIISTAIQIEQEAHDLYKKAQGQAGSEAGKELLGYLAEQELEHKAVLESLDLKKLEHIANEDLEALDFSKKLALTPINELEDLRDILKVAIERENQEMSAYARLKELACDKELEELFERLSSEENKHKELLEKEFSAMFE